MTCSVDNLEIITNTFGNDIVIGVECIFTWQQFIKEKQNQIKLIQKK